MFVQPASAFDHLVSRDRLSSQVEVMRAGNVEAVSTGEEPERAADARVDIEDLVLAIPRVVAVVEVEHPGVAQRFHPAPSEPVHRRVREADAEAGRAGVGRCLTELPSRQAEQALRVRVKVAIEQPSGIVAARDVLLEHEVRVARSSRSR